MATQEVSQVNIDYVQHWGDDLLVCNAAHVSFDKQSEWDTVTSEHEDSSGPYTEYVLSDKDAKLIHYLAKHKHTSCFEHMGATLKLKVPIFIARQIQRHRTFSYNEVSRRYVDNEPEFFWPDKWRGRAKDKKQGSSDEIVDRVWWTDVDNAYPCDEGAKEVAAFCLSRYNDMLKCGVAPEQARMILPQNMYTEFYMSGNLRAWEHFLKLRLDEHAQVEVQEVAKQVAEILQPLFPVSMSALMEN